MKFLIALVLMTSTSAFAYTPNYEVSVDENKIISLVVENDSATTLACSYNVSWFENTLTYKREFGSFAFTAGEYVVINYAQDIASRITGLKAHVDCK